MNTARVKVREDCKGIWWDFGIYEYKKLLLVNVGGFWGTKKAAIRNAKAMAKRIGILYDPEIIKQQGC